MAGPNQIAEAKSNHADSQTVQANVDGFKFTEIGSVPTDWQVISIEDALRSGVISDQMDGNHGELYPKSHEFASFGVPYIGATDFYSGRVNFKTCKYIPEKRAKKFRKGIAKNGDVLFAHNATVGPVALLKTDLEYVILSTTATYYRCNLKVLNNYYLSKFFESRFFVDQYSSVMSQSTRNQVPILAQRKFFIAVPGIEEQTAIANALSDIDALTNSLEKLIAKKQAIKTATMQQLLTGKTRLPQFATHPDGTPKGYKQSELGEIPEDWEVVPIGQLLERNTRITYGVVQPGKDDPNGVLFIRGGDVFDGKINVEALRKITVEISNSYSRTRLEGGELLISLVGFPGECAIVPRALAGANIARQVAMVRFAENKNGSAMFICQLLRSNFGKRLLLKEAFGSAQQVINLKDVNKLELPMPQTLKEQTSIAMLLSDMDEDLQLLDQRLTKVRQLKQGMMQELLTGKTRLVKPAGSAA